MTLKASLLPSVIDAVDEAAVMLVEESRRLCCKVRLFGDVSA